MFSKVRIWDKTIELTSPARLSFVLTVPLRYLRPSIIYSVCTIVPRDQIVQGPIANNPAVTQTTAIINPHTHFLSNRCLNG